MYAPGIASLKHYIQDLGTVTVVAPDIEQSGVWAFHHFQPTPAYQESAHEQ
ncbi:hypothetical protein [Candidatus Kuenenia stuttgartiensis]|uniref:hypothetical protein n=1 Tax=Kuenenia stuttgartiensis TaxID=174633 RepID=UPI0015627121